VCHYAECSYTECRSTVCGYAECHYAECHYDECHYIVCRYAECRGTFSAAFLFLMQTHQSWFVQQCLLALLLSPVSGKTNKMALKELEGEGAHLRLKQH